MDFYKPICKHVVIPVWAKWERSTYLEHIEYLDKSQYFTCEKVSTIQLGKIQKLLAHAYTNCQYYKNAFDRIQLHPKDIKTLEDYSRVPMLDKNDVLHSRDSIIALNFDKYASFLTSGSTGIPLSGFRNKASQDFKRACAVRSMKWAGYDLGERVYQLYGNPEMELKGFQKARAIFRRKALLRAEILDLLNLTQMSMIEFARKMRQKPPSLIWGHAHGMYKLASFYEDVGILDIRPKGMYSAGMVLHDWEKQKVEKVFNCVFQDRYGCEELGLIAAECKKTEGLHINSDDLYVEFLNADGKPVSAGERGAIVVTDLSNYVMPFIRYRMGDVGVFTNQNCSCGRTQPLIKKIEGRVADFLITPDKKLVSGISLTDHFAGHIPGIAQIQIVQDKIDHLRLKIVKDDRFNNDSLEQTTHLIKVFFGNEMNYDCEYVNEIPMEISGKYRFTICEVEHELL